MYNKVISIEIGSQRTKICELDYKKKNPHVYHCINFETPMNTFEDGYIRDKEKFVAVVKEKIKENNMKSNKVVFTIGSTKIANREITIPLIKESRIQDVIDTNASDYFPVEISEYTLTYSILEKIVSKEESKLRLSVLAAPNNLIKNYYSLAGMLGYEVMAIDYIGNSAYQMFRKEEGTEIKLIVQMNEQTTLISVLDGANLKLQRTVPYGTSSIIDAVLHNGYFLVESEKKAIQLLCNHALINSQLNVMNEEAAVTISLLEEDYMTNTRVREEITDSLKSLINNIQRVIDYYTSKNKGDKISSLYITGQGSRFKGMKELLFHETGIEVKIMELLPSVIFPKDVKMDRMEQSEYIATIGATIRPLHFVPKENLIKEKNNNRIHSRILMLSGSVVISIILVVSSYFDYISERRDNHQLTREIANLSDVNIVYAAHSVAMNQYNTVKNVYEMTENPNEELNEFIGELEQKLPTEAMIESFLITSTDFTLSMKVNSKESAAKVIQQLKTFETISQIDTSGLTEEIEKDGTKLVRFIITGQYKNTLEEDYSENN